MLAKCFRVLFIVFLLCFSASSMAQKKYYAYVQANKSFIESGKGKPGAWGSEKDYQNKRVVEVPFPVGFGYFRQTQKYQQLFKAFNHLRKLCGAPEPIQFE